MSTTSKMYLYTCRDKKKLIMLHATWKIIQNSNASHVDIVIRSSCQLNKRVLSKLQTRYSFHLRMFKTDFNYIYSRGRTSGSYL